MNRRIIWLGLAAILLLAACNQRSAAELIESGRRHIEASRCAGVDRYAEAISDLQGALAREPERLEAGYWLYRAYDEQGDAAGAARIVADMEAAVEAGRGGAEGRFWLLKVYHETGDEAGREAMLAALQAAVQAAPGDANGHYWLGRAYYELGRADEAIQSFQNALTMDPSHALAHFWLGQVYAENNRLAEARQQFDAALALESNNAAAYHNRGVVAYQLQEIEQALADFQAAVENDPEDPRSHYQLGATFLARGLPTEVGALPDSASLERAQAEFERALELCPGMTEPLIGLGNLYLIQGNTTAALESLNQAAEQAPDSPQVWFALAQVHMAAGQVDEACQAIRQFLALDPPAEWVAQANLMSSQLGCP